MVLSELTYLWKAEFDIIWEKIVFTSRSHMTHLSQHLDIGVFFLEDPGEFCQQTQVFLSVMFLNVALHIEEFLRTEGNGCLFQEW